ncbi:MAG TPA: alpha/beta hydrolase [Gemmatimonadaceae bacterium]|nr:alpha/beta hydrolase [Gemmatimonadaceae bacterium]
MPPERMYPAGVPGISVRWLTLPSGLRVRAAQAGAESAPPVVLLAGWGASLYMFRRNILPLADAGFRVSAVDLKGQGLSDKPDDPAEYTLESLTSHVLEVLDALGAKRAAVVAQSMAGAVATHVAVTDPSRISRLALVSPVGFGRVPLIRPLSRLAGVMAPVAPYFASRRVFERAVRWAYGWRGAPTRRDVEEYWAPSRDPLFVRSLFLLLRHMDWELLDEQVLRGIRCSLLLIFGTDDRVVSPSDCERLAAKVPDARSLLIPGAGHAALEIASDVVNPELAAFLKP